MRDGVVKMARVNRSMELHFPSPFNRIFSVKKLKENPGCPEAKVIGTGCVQVRGT